MKGNLDWKHIRRKVMKRDGYICQVAGCPVRGSKNLTVHHIVPRSEGGGDNLDNLIALCPKHHDEIESASPMPKNRAQIIGWPGLEEWELEHSQEVVSSVILDAFSETKNHKGIIPRPKGEKTGRLPKIDTVVAVQELYGKLGSWNVVARDLHKPPEFASILSSVAREIPGAISEQKENELRRLLAIHFGYQFPEFTIRKSSYSLPPDTKKQSQSKDTNFPNPDTVIALKKVKTGKTWRQLAKEFGKPSSYAATLSRVARGGHVSIREENFIREQLGLPSLPEFAPAPICPHCGVVHAVGDCGGVPGEPVILPPDARIVKPKRKRPEPPVWVSKAADNLQSLLEARRPPEPSEYSRAWWWREMKR